MDWANFFTIISSRLVPIYLFHPSNFLVRALVHFVLAFIPPPWYFPFSTPLTVSITCGTDVKWEKNNENETKKKRGKVAKKRRGKNFLRHLPDWSTSLVTSTDNNGLKGRRGAGELDDATKRPLRSTSPSKFDSTFWLKRKRRGKKLASAENV